MVINYDQYNFKIYISVLALQRLEMTKLKISSIVSRDIYYLKGFVVLEQFLGKFRVFISPNFDDYMNGVKHKNRRIIAYLLLFLDYFMVIRFAILTYVNLPWIWTLLGDAFYMWGSTGYVTAALGFFGCSIASINTLYLILETNHKLLTIDFIENIRNRRMEWELEDRYYSKFCVRVKFLTKILYPTLIGCAFVPVAGHGITSIISYVIDDVHQSVIPLIISNIMISIWMLRATAMGLGGSLLIYFIIKYLKFKFNQLNDLIEKSYRLKNSRLLLKAIERHQRITLSVKQMNQIISYVFGFTYMSCTPPLNILFSLGFKSHIHPIVRCIYISVAIQICMIIYLLNLTASSFSSDGSQLNGYYV